MGAEERADAPGLVTAYLYAADDVDREIELEASTLEDLTEQQLVWVDVSGDEEEAVRRVTGLLDLDDAVVEELLSGSARPRITDFDRCFLVTLRAVDERPEGSAFLRIDAVVGDSWIVSTHQGSIDLVKALHGSVRGQTALGRLSGPAFLTLLLDWLLIGYFRAVEAVEAEIDRIDEMVLSRQGADDRPLDALMRLRRRVTALRRGLSPHRDVFTVLAHPDFDVLSASDTAPRYERLYERLERAIDAVESTREMVLGSLEVLMALTAERTNEVMKVLTIMSAVLLPAVVLGGIMGMNVNPGFFNRPNTPLFVGILGTMVALASVVLIVARRRHWF